MNDKAIMRVVKMDSSEPVELMSPDDHARSILEKILKEKPTGLVIIYEVANRSTRWKSSPDSAFAENGLIDAAFELIHADID